MAPPRKYATDEERKAAKAEKDRKRRLRETDEQRESRLQRMRRRLENETDEQRELRLQKKKSAYRRRMDQETDEQRAVRLGNMRRRLESETNVERELRLQNMRSAYRLRMHQETGEQSYCRLQQLADSFLQSYSNNLNNKLQKLANDMIENENVVDEHYCGSLDNACTSCHAKHFLADKPDKDGTYSECCQKGKVFLPEQDFPEYLKKIMTNQDEDHSKNFMENVRAINSSFAFASIGADIAPPAGFGPYCFRIHGQIYHRTGSFLEPSAGKPPRYAQSYILDTEAATKYREAYKTIEHCNKDLMKKLCELLTDINVFAPSYKMLHEVEEEARQEAIRNGTMMPSVCIAIKHDQSKDIRPYSATNANEVAVVFEDNNGEPPFERDILVHCRPDLSNPNAKHTKPVSILNTNLDAMLYPLFFPRSERGWGNDIPLMVKQGSSSEDVELQVGNTTRNSRNRVSQMQYYRYKLQVRDKFNPILYGGKLTQQFAVDAYSRMEANRLKKVDSSSGIMDDLNTRAENEKLKVGRTAMLPSTFEGSPRNYQQRYQDAMAIVAKFGKPDLFVTMACNPEWKEITANLEEWQKDHPEHRPDIVARVFLIKLNSLLEDIQNGLFGKVVAKTHVIEFQKHGLPHARILIILDQNSKLRNENDIDRIVSAEIPDREKYPILYDIVIRNMIHTPCGKNELKAVCMDNGECMERFPKEFNEVTIGNIDGFVKYKRKRNDPVEFREKFIDNRWVVPYNPFLLKKYNCHINVEVCTSIKSVKHLFKYVYKGHDRSIFKLKENEIAHDEPDEFSDLRYVGATEAIWRIFSYPMHNQSHTIIRLTVHLPKEHTLYFNEADESDDLANKMSKSSTLMAWFELNQNDVNARYYLYCEIPEYYVFTKGKWNARKANRKSIGRMYSVSVMNQERYFLRLLLLHVRGATSFESLRTVDGVIYSTYKEAAKAKGLLLDDTMWHATLVEAIVFSMPKQLRDLFAYICVFGPPIDHLALWNEFKSYLAEDYCLREQYEEGECNHCESYALKEIEDVLITLGKSYENFNLPIPAMELPNYETELDEKTERRKADSMIQNLNEKQLQAFNEIKAAIEDKRPRSKCFFIDGPGGSGKTYLYRTLIHYVRGLGKIVLPAATTGIAANLLSEGRTIHSLFGLPTTLNETSVSNIKVNSKAAESLRNADLLIIDDCTMASNHAINAIDRLLQEVMDNTTTFGGKVVTFGGDFRQCLPIIPRAMRPAIVQSCMKFSKPWKDGKFRHLALNANMRSDDPDYNEWILNLGNGTIEEVNFSEQLSLVEIPTEFLCENIVYETFGENINFKMIQEISKNVILCPKNDDVDKLNQHVMDILEGEYITYLSDDSVKEEPQRDNFTVEFLNSITPSGMPNHCLKLKVGAIIMLLINLNTKRGLCEGTRLVVTTLKPNLIEAEVLTGPSEAEKVFITRIDLCPSEQGLPFRLNRRQFPVKPAFAMTINNLQGQTLNRVGIYLPEPVFRHGQLYMAFSRARERSKVKIQIAESPLQGKLLKYSDKVFTRNVVFREVL